MKDESGTGGYDCAWIDDVVLPKARWDAAYGCPDIVDSGTLVKITESGEWRAENWELYPNPSRGEFTVYGIQRADYGGERSMVVSDIYGRVVESVRIADNGLPLTVDMSHLSDGVYIVALYAEGGVSYKKLIINH